MKLLDVLKLDDGGVIDTLFKLFHFGPQEDGDLPSKSGFGWLCDQGFAAKDYDKPLPNALTLKGLQLWTTLGPEDVKVLAKDFPRLQFDNFLKIQFAERTSDGFEGAVFVGGNVNAMLNIKVMFDTETLRFSDRSTAHDYMVAEYTDVHGTVHILGPGDMITFLDHDTYPVMTVHALWHKDY